MARIEMRKLLNVIFFAGPKISILVFQSSPTCRFIRLIAFARIGKISRYEEKGPTYTYPTATAAAAARSLHSRGERETSLFYPGPIIYSAGAIKLAISITHCLLRTYEKLLPLCTNQDLFLILIFRESFRSGWVC